MEAVLQLAILELLEKSITAMEATGEFMADQIPEVVYQLLFWHGVKSGILCLIGILLFVATVKIDIRQLKWINENVSTTEIPETRWESWEGGSMVVPFVLVNGSYHAFVLPILLLEFLNLQWLQIWLAPKAWLIEYGANLVK